MNNIHPNKNIELLVDSICVGSTCGSQYDLSLGDDIIYEGWINLDKSGNPSQKLYYFPPKRTLGRQGAIPITHETVEVPPGSIILYNLNEVVPLDINSNVSENTYKLLMTWRITNSTKPIFKKLSKEIPPIYTHIHIINIFDIYKQFCVEYFCKFVLFISWITNIR